MRGHLRGGLVSCEMKTLKAIAYALLYVWQLPQNLVGLFLLLYYRKECKVHEEGGTVFYIVPSVRGGFSMGRYIFLSKRSLLREPVYDHEYGHTRQSRYLGPLYLLVIGLCSGIHCMLYDGKGGYYDFWTERWANKLGGIPGYAGEGKYHEEGYIHTVYEKLAAMADRFK